VQSGRCNSADEWSDAQENYEEIEHEEVVDVAAAGGA